MQPYDDPAGHEPMIREAERNGHAFAALWHLDRLVAARPDDWFLHARRAHVWSLSDRSDRFDRAAEDYRHAERLGSREQVLDFQLHCVLDCTEAGRWAEALWYLDRLIAARPDDAALHEDRAAVYGKLGREADRRAELARAFELGADQGLVIPRAEELGRAGRWAEAADLLARCGRSDPLSRELAQAWVIACLKAGDRAGYRAGCAAFLAGQGPDPTVVWNALAAASFFAVGADGLDDYRVPIGWCEKRLSAVPAPGPLYRHIFASALGGLLLRAGRVDEAIVRLNEGIAAAQVEIPTDWAYLALAHAKKGDLVEARRSLERLRASRPDSSASFWELQELELLRGEAESLLLDADFPSDPFHAEARAQAEDRGLSPSGRAQGRPVQFELRTRIDPSRPSRSPTETRVSASGQSGSASTSRSLRVAAQDRVAEKEWGDALGDGGSGLAVRAQPLGQCSARRGWAEGRLGPRALR